MHSVIMPLGFKLSNFFSLVLEMRYFSWCRLLCTIPHGGFSFCGAGARRRRLPGVAERSEGGADGGQGYCRRAGRPTVVYILLVVRQYYASISIYLP